MAAKKSFLAVGKKWRPCSHPFEGTTHGLKALAVTPGGKVYVCALGGGLATNRSALPPALLRRRMKR